MGSLNTKKIIKAILALIGIFILIKLLILFIPHERSFSSVYKMNNASVKDVFVWDEYTGSYVARSNHHSCYIDTDKELAETSDTESITVKTHPIGIRIYSTDMMGVWVRYPVIVYAY